jgi:hypothetical protein
MIRDLVARIDQAHPNLRQSEHGDPILEICHAICRQQALQRSLSIYLLPLIGNSAMVRNFMYPCWGRMPEPCKWFQVLFCVSRKGVLTPRDLFSWVKTANKMRSMLVLSWKVPIGLVRRLLILPPLQGLGAFYRYSRDSLKSRGRAGRWVRPPESMQPI